MKKEDEIIALAHQTDLYKDNSNSKIVQKAIEWGFIAGYKNAKAEPTDKWYTLEDIKLAIKMAREGNIGYHAPDAPMFYFDKTYNDITQHFISKTEQDEKTTQTN